MNKSYLTAFNQPDSILVISSYPEKGLRYSGKVCALDSFAKNTLSSLKDYFAGRGRKRKIVVLALSLEKEEIYQEEGILVWPVFRRNKPLSYLKAWQVIRQFDRIKDVLVEFEFASFGDTKMTALFPFFLFTLRFLGKKTTLVLHQVVQNLEEIASHFGWNKNSLKVKMFDLGLKFVFWFLVAASHKVIVLEEFLKERLIQMVGSREKIVVIPHGVDQNLRLVSRPKSKELTILYFGYLAWYKGIDFLVRTFVENRIEVDGKPVRLVIAGGESPTQKTKTHYQKFIKGIYNLAKKSEQVTITGYVEEKDIPLYFSMADLVVFPYRTFMSSSGPLSLACSFKKPFLVSTHLASYLDSSDFLASFEEGGLKKEDILFSLRQEAFIKKIKSILQNQDKKLAKLAKFSEALAKRRSFSVLAPCYAQILEAGRYDSTSKAIPRILFAPMPTEG